MRPVYLSLLYVSVLVTVRPFEADCSDCYSEIKVRRDTTYKIIEGRDLVINCTVVFCNSSTSSVSWFKVPVGLNNQSHIKSEWKELKKTEGIFYLTFQKIRSNDSGLYQCRIGSDTISHNINVTVLGYSKSTTVKPPLTTLETAQDTTWPFVYRAAAAMVFVIIVIAIFIKSKRQCTGTCCVGQSGNEPDLSLNVSHHAVPAGHIYENDTC